MGGGEGAETDPNVMRLAPQRHVQAVATIATPVTTSACDLCRCQQNGTQRTHQLRLHAAAAAGRALSPGPATGQALAARGDRLRSVPHVTRKRYTAALRERRKPPNDSVNHWGLQAPQPPQRPEAATGPEVRGRARGRAGAPRLRFGLAPRPSPAGSLSTVLLGATLEHCLACRSVALVTTAPLTPQRPNPTPGFRSS